jgi:hypothetical protein
MKAATTKPSPTKGSDAKRIAVQTPNVPGYISTVDAGMYEAMKGALLKALPQQAPGLTQAEMLAALIPHLPADRFPGGAKAGWWMKCVQLDLEAKGILVREQTKPLRWHQQ